MNISKLCLLFCTLVIFSGCATAPLRQDVSQDMRTCKTAVAYAQLEKKINYNELVYKVLWNENRTQDASFDGLWDIDYDLSQYMAPRIAKLGLNTISIYDVVPAKEMSALHDNLKSLRTVEGYMISEKKLVLDDSLRKNLRKKGIDYLITVDSDYVYIYTQIGVKSGSARTGLRIVDIRTNEQQYFSVFPVAGNFKVEENAREIENNDLAGFKHMMKEWLDQAIRQQMPKLLGLAETKS